MSVTQTAPQPRDSIVFALAHPDTKDLCQDSDTELQTDKGLGMNTNSRLLQWDWLFIALE